MSLQGCLDGEKLKYHAERGDYAPFHIIVQQESVLRTSVRVQGRCFLPQCKRRVFFFLNHPHRNKFIETGKPLVNLHSLKHKEPTDS